MDLPPVGQPLRTLTSPAPSYAVHCPSSGASRVEIGEALLLRVIGELSYEEVASVCGSSVAAIKMRVSRARRRLTGLPPGA